MSTRRRFMMQSGGGGGEEYIQNGLVHRLVAEDYDGTTWQCRLSDYNLTKNPTAGTVQKGDKYIQFSYRWGSGYQMIGNRHTDISYVENLTFECVFSGKGKIFIDFGMFSFETNGADNTTTNISSVGIRDDVTGIQYSKEILDGGEKKIRSISATKNVILCNFIELVNVGFITSNGSSIEPSSIGLDRNYWTTRSSFVGEIYEIRIYNRQLTKEEMLHNQQIDNERFHLGL